MVPSDDLDPGRREASFECRLAVAGSLGTRERLCRVGGRRVELQGVELVERADGVQDRQCGGPFRRLRLGLDLGEGLGDVLEADEHGSAVPRGGAPISSSIVAARSGMPAARKDTRAPLGRGEAVLVALDRAGGVGELVVQLGLFGHRQIVGHVVDRPANRGRRPPGGPTRGSRPGLRRAPSGGPRPACRRRVRSEPTSGSLTVPPASRRTRPPGRGDVAARPA